MKAREHPRVFSVLEHTMKLATRTEVLTESLPLKIAAKAKKMIADGMDIVNLTVGEPDFPSPENIKRAGIKAIEDNFTRYTPAAGILPLRKAISNHLKKDHRLDYSSNQIVITNGAKQALASTLLAVVNPGEEVIYPVPCYASYVDLIRLAGGVPVPLITKQNEGFRIKTERLEKLITKKTAAIILNNPNNPTGAAYTPNEVLTLGSYLRDKNIWILADEIYDRLRYDGQGHLSFASIEGLKEKVAYINGVSKYYSMTGWRIGFVAAPAELASTVGKIQSQMTGSPVSVSQMAAAEAYTGGDEAPLKMVDAFASRAKLISELMRDIPKVSFHEPEGAFYIFVDVSRYLGKSRNGSKISTTFELCQYLLDEHNLAIIPGSAFGVDTHVRFSFAANENELKRGVERFKAGLLAL